MIPRPNARSFKTEEELQEKINEYFDLCNEGIHITDDGKVVLTKACCIGGLCVHLGITRTTLFEYESNEKYGYSNTVKLAKSRIEAWLEEHSLLRSKGIDATVAIFNLKCNFKWRDKDGDGNTTIIINDKAKEILNG